ncbi:MAG: patatin-like phospholipase family protein [Lachnospiraceae bacterium]|nr:patatin-like phospholipase family protein [Lachnospiraceae bacterium]
MSVFKGKRVKRIGLVFAGGGGKGSYEVGVWKYMHEVGMDKYITAVSGTSVGGLNAAMVIGADVSIAEEMWAKCTREKILLVKKPSSEQVTEWVKKEALIVAKSPKGLAAKVFRAAKDYISQKSEKDKKLSEGELLLEDKQAEINPGSDIKQSETKLGSDIKQSEKNTGSDIKLSETEGERKLSVLAYKAMEYISSDSFFSREGLERIIDETLDFDKTMKSKIPCYITCLRCSDRKVERFLLNGKTRDEIVPLLLATTAIPVIFPSVEMNGEQYSDGGLTSFGDNVPVKPVYDDPNVDAIVVVHLTKKDQETDKIQFAGKDIIDIFPSEDLGNAITGALDFTGEGAEKRIKQGYADAKEQLRPLLKDYLTKRQLKNVVKKESGLEEVLNQVRLMWNEDLFVCPECGKKIEYKQKSAFKGAGWKCGACGKKFDTAQVLKDFNINKE